MENQRQPVSFIATDRPDEALAFFADIIGLQLREATPDGHKFAWFKDPSGNMLSLTQYSST
jgi:catechol 2,3-dioxygenase-like lactoylglutathione lyase family enzyme